MSKVHRLPDALANQIAAGEVVERPASAVKELVENAIDAGARRVEVRVEDGGRRRIEVVDDGSGMSREDALLALERHTTSKLRSAEDLFDIRTFGFRGEALPSIASVSRFTLTTRRADDLAATRIVVEGGRVTAVEDAGAPAGTRIEVDDLFFNVPARLKFLKTRATELGHVADWLTRLGLANPHVAMTLSEEGRTHLRADATTDLRERIAALLGRDLHGALYAVEADAGAMRLSGYAAGPQRANATAREIHTFVNRRFVRDRGLLHAVARAYEGVLPIGRSPACVLFLDVDPARVDVNVHPQKLEVRFADRLAYDVVAKSLAQMLARSPWLEHAAPARTYTLRPTEPAPAPRPVQSTLAQVVHPAGLTPVQQRVSDALDRFTDRHLERDDAVTVRDSQPVPPPAPVVRPVETPAPILPLAPARAEPRLRFADLRYLGQVHRTYLACEAPDGLVLLDQHAAHERVLYEKYKAERAGEATKGQPFLVPLTLELAPAEARLVEAAIEELGELGFDLEPFGGTTLLLKAAPAALEGSDLRKQVLELATELRAFGRGSSADAMEEAVLARMACHAAVRAGHALEREEAVKLLELLDGTPFHAQCPHGRPVVVRFDVEHLKELFARDYQGTPKAAGRDRIGR